MNERVLILICLLAFPLAFLAQDNSPTPKLRHYDENSGFQTTNFIYDVKVDSDGLVWIVDFSGISIFDGGQFKSINTSSVSHSSLLRFYEDSSGRKYVIDFLGKLFFIQEDSLIAAPQNKSIEELKPRNGFSDLFFDDQGRLHISYYKVGYVIIDDEKVKYPLTGSFAGKRGEFIWMRKEGDPFIFTHQGKNSGDRERHFYLLNSKMKLMDSISAPKNEFKLPASYQLKDKNKNGYIANGRGELFKLIGGKLSRPGNIDSSVAISNIVGDQHGGLWLSTADHGIRFFKHSNLEGNPTYALLENDGATVSAIDKEGGAWLHSPDKGLLHIPYPRYVYFSEQNALLLNNHVFGLEVKDDKLYAGSDDNKISAVDLRKLKLDSLLPAVNGNKAIYNIYADPVYDNLWISLRGELYFKHADQIKWNKLKTKGFDETNSGDIVRILGFLRQQNSLVVVINNQFCFIRDRQIHYISEPFPDDIYAVEAFGDSLMVGAEDGLYVQYRGKIKYLGTEHNALKERVYSINQLGEWLIVSQKNQGLVALHNGEFERLKYQSEVLNKAAVFKIDEGSLLVISREGSFRLSIEKDSLNWEAFQRLPKITAGNFILRDSTVYWGTWKDGVFATRLQDIFLDSLSPPNFEVNSIKIDGEPLKKGVTEFEIPYHKGLIEFNFRAISFQNWKLKYRYRLKGLKEEWTVIDERKVQYSTLPAGKYVFQIQARKGEQLWSPAREFNFTVTPPFWKTWWFISIMIVLLALIAYFLITYRIGRVKREKDLIIDRLEAEQRALRAQMDPHFVFNIVSSAQYLVMKEENEKAIHFLNKFSQLMRNILDYSNTNYISLKEEIDFLKDYVELEQIRLEDSFEVNWELEGKMYLEEILIPPFIIQPFVENAIHHGLKNKEGERKLRIMISNSGKNLTIEVEDNGIGRESAAKYMSNAKQIRKSHGLRILRERLQLHNAAKNNIQIDDLHENGKACGTRIRLRLKINNHESINR